MKRLLLGVLLLAACGDDDDGGTAADAAAGADAPQGAADAAPADAPLAPDAPPATPDAAVDVFANCGTPIGQATVAVPPGASLVVHCPDGLPSAILQGGANPVSIDVVDGTMVTMVGVDIPITILDIKPDQLINPFVDQSSGTVATASVSLPGAFAGAVNYSIDSGCSSASGATPGTPADVFVDSECSADDKFVLYATALDANDRPLAYTFAVDVAVGAGNPSVTLPAWRTDFVTVPLHLTNAPTPFAGGVGLAGARAGFGAGPARFQTIDADPEMIAGGGAIDYAIAFVPAAFADRVIVKVLHGSINQNDPNDTAVHTTFRRISPVPAAVTIDLTADSLPLIHQIDVDFSVPGRPALEWTEVAPLAAVDVKVGGFFGQSGGWEFIGPPGTSSPTVMPVLPPSLGQTVPAAPLQPIFFAIDLDSLAGYDDVLTGGIVGLNPDGFDEPKGVNSYRVVSGGDM